ncbi:hypothetical protein AA13595_0781 [Gluconacetobacter johannae DSM 13595]|uniref:Toprim domain-containing protein n=1 Tax=Gluconacetobacter johannae TaxID=112140 RepID=A0A7W4J9P0_9PROT|nr:hypothetical protein [Gluconacetobacter johannae]MBB2177247.1 hypothetical protein [Gluconacetobacter johannae]GBQ81937.1 hypothetical protein AA13595_0781 [Gluconacetobacter johannae DSM 13595]
MAAAEMDFVARYALSQGWSLKPRTILVEGTSDVALFGLAARLFCRSTGKDLLGDLAILAAGEGDRGGTHGVVRELVTMRNLSRAYLSPAGRPVYRVIGLFDNDVAGQKAVKGARNVDASIIEYRDVFRLRPKMPLRGNLDHVALKRSFEEQNEAYKGLSWELEDLIGPALMELFLDEHPTALMREHVMFDRTHRELTRDGKSRLVRFCQIHADLANLNDLVTTMHAIRHYLVLPTLA